jgi:hypothetical protein
MKFSMKKPNVSVRALLLLWFRSARKAFILLFFVAIGFGVSIWYEDVYRSEWTDEEKRAYAETAFQETVFNEAEFRKSIMAAEKRAVLHEEDATIENDFFVPIPGMEEKR